MAAANTQIIVKEISAIYDNAGDIISSIKNNTKLSFRKKIGVRYVCQQLGSYSQPHS